MGQAGIAKIRELIRALNYVVILHVTEELEDDNLTILDLENIVFTGEIVTTQRDRKTREVKYLVCGKTLEGRQAEVVVKARSSGTLVIVTVYVL